MKIKCGRDGEFEIHKGKLVKSNGIVAWLCNIKVTGFQRCGNYNLPREGNPTICETTWKRIKKYFRELPKGSVKNGDSRFTYYVLEIDPDESENNNV